MKVRFSALPLYSRPAVWALIPGLVLVTLYAYAQVQTKSMDGYWVGVVSTSTDYVVFSCAIGAMVAALDGAWLRKHRWQLRNSSRPWWSIGWSVLWPTLVMSVTFQGWGLLLSIRHTWGAPGRFPLEILGAWAAMVAVHLAGGFLIGLALPTLAAAPVALVASYCWLGFTWAVSYVPLRYLSGLVLDGCCEVNATLAPEAPAAVAIFSLAALISLVAIVRWLMTGSPKLRYLAPLSVVPLIAGTVVGLTVASHLGPYPSPARDTADLQCRQQISEICFYPEQLWNVPVSPYAMVNDALTALKSNGVAIPSRVTASFLDDGSDTVRVVYKRYFTPAQAVHSLVSSMAFVDPDCRHSPELWETATVTSGIMYQLATNGMKDPAVVGPQQDAISRLGNLPENERNRWIREAREAIDHCRANPPAVP